MNTVSGEEKKEERKEREDQKKEKIESGKYRVKGEKNIVGIKE